MNNFAAKASSNLILVYYFCLDLSKDVNQQMTAVFNELCAYSETVGVHYNIKRWPRQFDEELLAALRTDGYDDPRGSRPESWWKFRSVRETFKAISTVE